MEPSLSMGIVSNPKSGMTVMLAIISSMCSNSSLFTPCDLMGDLAPLIFSFWRPLLISTYSLRFITILSLSLLSLSSSSALKCLRPLFLRFSIGIVSNLSVLIYGTASIFFIIGLLELIVKFYSSSSITYSNFML